MKEKIIELNFSLTESEAKSGYVLSGDERSQFERNRNTTIAFVIIILMFVFNIITTVTNQEKKFNDGLIITSIAFIAISVCFIIATWVSGKTVIKNAIKSSSDGTPYKMFINQNGISFIYGENPEETIPKGDFTVKSNDEIYLIVCDGKKLVIPKRAVLEEDKETVKDFLFGKTENN